MRTTSQPREPPGSAGEAVAQTPVLSRQPGIRTIMDENPWIKLE